MNPINITDMIQDMREPLDQYLDAIEGELLDGKVSRVERQCTLADVEAQVLTLLQRRVDQGETLDEALLSSVLSEMDPAERYRAAGEQLIQPRPEVLLAGATAFSASEVRSNEASHPTAANNSQPNEEPAANSTGNKTESTTIPRIMVPRWDTLALVALSSMILATFLLLIHEVPAGILIAVLATVCGIVSIFRIRASDGYFHGLPYAFAAAVTYPVILSLIILTITGLWIVVVAAGAVGIYAMGLYFLWKKTKQGYIARPLPKSNAPRWPNFQFPVWKKV